MILYKCTNFGAFIKKCTRILLCHCTKLVLVSISTIWSTLLITGIHNKITNQAVHQIAMLVILLQILSQFYFTKYLFNSCQHNTTLVKELNYHCRITTKHTHSTLLTSATCCLTTTPAPITLTSPSFTTTLLKVSITCKITNVFIGRNSIISQ